VTRHLAQLNVGLLRHPLDDPRSAGFAEAVEEVHRLAESTPGFVWRLSERPVTPTPHYLFDDPLAFVTLSVWEGVAPLREFVFESRHRDFLDRRAEWFEPLDEAHMVMWWIKAGHRPNLPEAKARLLLLRKRGPTKHAFGWREAGNG
jgi:hypothetical protein